MCVKLADDSVVSLNGLKLDRQTVGRYNLGAVGVDVGWLAESCLIITVVIDHAAHNKAQVLGGGEGQVDIGVIPFAIVKTNLS